MKLEDYSKYYIQGSDHYLVPKYIFVELFNEMTNWKQENKELKSQLKGTTHCYDEEEHRQLKEQLSSITLQLEKSKENFRATNKGLKKVVLKRKKWKHRYELTKHEIKELKKQLEKLTNENNILDTKIGKYIEQRDEWIELLNMFKKQQQEFIKYLKNPFNYTTFEEVIYDEILQKYLEIIGGNKDEN